MRKLELEHWILNIADRVSENKPIEDDRVELKSEWPSNDHNTARQLAAHANTSRGEPILWIIGLDEERGVLGVKLEELSNWWSRVTKWFDEQIYPDLTSINVAIQKNVLVGLFFETDRAPYVIKNKKGGVPEREVPWRSANSTKTAHRSDLIRILVPIQRKPEFEIIDAKLHLRESINSENKKRYYFYLNLDLYAKTLLKEPVVIPFHQVEVKFKSDGDEIVIENADLFLKIPTFTFIAHDSGGLYKQPPKPDSHTMQATSSELIIHGPGKVTLEADLSWNDDITFPPPEEIDVTIVFNPAGDSNRILIQQKFERNEYSKGQPIIAKYIQ